MYDDEFDDFEEYDGDIELINDLPGATPSDYSSPVYFAEVGVSSPSDWEVIHSDIQSLHWSILCIYVVFLFMWICKQWG